MVVTRPEGSVTLRFAERSSRLSGLSRVSMGARNEATAAPSMSARGRSSTSQARRLASKVTPLAATTRIAVGKPRMASNAIS